MAPPLIERPGITAFMKVETDIITSRAAYIWLMGRAVKLVIMCAQTFKTDIFYCCYWS
jgi:hypothetical protein